MFATILLLRLRTLYMDEISIKLTLDIEWNIYERQNNSKLRKSSPLLAMRSFTSSWASWWFSEENIDSYMWDLDAIRQVLTNKTAEENVSPSGRKAKQQEGLGHS